VPRPLRHQLVGLHSTNHCTWRSHDGIDVFADDDVARYFLLLLARYKSRYGILIHSYCLMGTHPHVLVTATQGQKAFSGFWQVVNRQLAVYFNKKNKRRGQLVMERLRSPAIQPDGRHMTVMRYGDLNPVRAGLAKSAAEWTHSSFQHYAYGKTNPLIDDAPDYVALGSTPGARQQAYLNFFETKQVEPLLQRCPELVSAPFIGNAVWVDLQRSGLSPRMSVMDSQPDGLQSASLPSG
jgi:putative transposase